MKTKIFEYRGQMVNYYNKLIYDPSIKSAYMGIIDGEYTVMYEKKSERTEWNDQLNTTTNTQHNNNIIVL